jgi:hypothetical protein
MNESILLTKYREVTADHYREVRRRRDVALIEMWFDYAEVIGQLVDGCIPEGCNITVSEVIAWAEATGRFGPRPYFREAVEDALHGHLDKLRGWVATDNMPFILHPARLVRAIENVLARAQRGDLPPLGEEEGAGLNEAQREMTAILLELPDEWGRLAETDCPFCWPVPLLVEVVQAVQEGKLRTST